MVFLGTTMSGRIIFFESTLCLKKKLVKNNVAKKEFRCASKRKKYLGPKKYM